MPFKVLFFGDVVGALGRKAVAALLPTLKEKFAPDLTIANVENLAHGAGVTAQTLTELVTAGVDAFTGGNHSWDNPLGAPLFEQDDWKARLIAPTNYGGAKNGQNATLIKKNGSAILLVNVMGRLFTHPDTTSPFEAFERVLAEYKKDAPHGVIVDIHGEASAEKEAFGHFADGRASAVFGTHTHIPSADAKILPGGTGYVTDIGRCGAYDSVIGFEKNSVIKRFLNDGPLTYELPKSGKAEVNAMLVTLDLETGRTTQLDRIREFVDILAA